MISMLMKIGSRPRYVTGSCPRTVLPTLLAFSLSAGNIASRYVRKPVCLGMGSRTGMVGLLGRRARPLTTGPRSGGHVFACSADRVRSHEKVAARNGHLIVTI